MTVELKDYVLVKVPGCTKGKFLTYQPYLKENRLYCSPTNSLDNEEAICIVLPKAKKLGYQIIGLAKDLTEDQWFDITSFLKGKFKDWNSHYWTLDTATESGHSLLKHHKLELENTLILKRKN